MNNASFNSDEARDWIKKEALALGFDTVGFAPSALPSDAKAGLMEFLAAGHHGGMDWMERNAERRADPRELWPEVQSIIVLGHNYGPASDPLQKLAEKDHGVISVYALNQDYHDVLKKKLRVLGEALAKRYDCGVKLFVDTAPVLEKPIAAQTQLGWAGKHTCIVSREFGSWLFLAELFTTLPLTPDAPEHNHCGSCSRCLDICPTQAFTEAGKLDARKCISYLTIEHKGHIPREFRKAIGNRIYGCDDCLAVCPWNKFAQSAREAAYHARAELEFPLLSDLLALDDQRFRELFRKSPVKRIGRDRFVRNALIAAGNSGNAGHTPQIRILLEDASPLVRAMAVWALSRLAKQADFLDDMRQYKPQETDPAIQHEWKEGAAYHGC